MENSIDRVVDEVFDLFVRFGQEDYIGEPVSQLEHMSQAAQLARKEGFDDEVVLAAFLHDIGHICVMSHAENSMNGYGMKSHEKIGADFLKQKGFPEKIVKLVENHVQAKRYLTYKFPGYVNNLSAASKKTLEFQGGSMDQEEAESFEKDPLFDLSIRLREWDEMAKEVNIPVLPMEYLKAMTLRLLAQHWQNQKVS